MCVSPIVYLSSGYFPKQKLEKRVVDTVCSGDTAGLARPFPLDEFNHCWSRRKSDKGKRFSLGHILPVRR